MKRDQKLLAGVAGVLVILGLWFVFGRSTPFASVAGYVAVNGYPIEEGTLSFTHLDKGKSASVPIQQGIYSVPLEGGLLAGKNRVRIIGYRKTGKKVSAPPSLGGGTSVGGGSDTQEMVDEKVQYIPAEYNDRSELGVELKPGANPDVNFDLPSPNSDF